MAIVLNLVRDRGENLVPTLFRDRFDLGDGYSEFPATFRHIRNRSGQSTPVTTTASSRSLIRSFCVSSAHRTEALFLLRCKLVRSISAIAWCGIGCSGPMFVCIPPSKYMYALLSTKSVTRLMVPKAYTASSFGIA